MLSFDALNSVVLTETAKKETVSGKPKGYALLDNVIDYKSSKGTLNKVYQATIDKHYISEYKDGEKTGQQVEVIDIWVYPQDEEIHLGDKNYKPNLATKAQLDETLKKLKYVTFPLEAFTEEAVKKELAGFIQKLSETGCKVSEVKNAEKKVVGYKTCMVKLRLVPVGKGQYTFKVLRPMPFKRG